VAAATDGSTILIVRGDLHEEIVSTSIIAQKKLIIKPFAGSMVFQ
jgi:hypothetical protein